MKKFLVCLCTSIPSVKKGIYTALCLLMYSIPVFAQVEKTDKTPISAPFNKWEVGFDLKPLFRSDEPYNVLGKWHFTERKAVRLGLGTANWSKSNDTLLIYESEFLNNQTSIQYEQAALYNVKKTNINIKVGYQYEFKHGKIDVYTATDFNWIKETLDLHSPYQVHVGTQGKIDPFVGYQSIFFIYNRKTIYGLIQSLGFRYSINGYLSCAFETSLIGQYVEFVYTTDEFPYVDPVIGNYIKNSTKGGHETHLSFKPLMGLFINYHF